MSDRLRDKFTYTSVDQIKLNPPRPLRQLKHLIEQQDLDPAKVLHLIRNHLDDLRKGTGDEG